MPRGAAKVRRVGTVNPNDRMKITLLTYGSRGDVQPCLALAAALQSQGHSPLLVLPAFLRLQADGLPRTDQDAIHAPSNDGLRDRTQPSHILRDIAHITMVSRHTYCPAITMVIEK